MMLTQELAFLKAKEEFQKMIELAKQAANNGVQIHDVETDLWEVLLKMGRYMLQGYVGTQGTGDLGPTLEYEGQPLNRLEGLFDRRYVSIFGALTIPRTVYGTRLTRLKKGQKAGKKREACVGGVYTVEPFVRTADDVVDEFLRKKSKEKRPVPQNKQLRAALTQEIEGHEVKGKEQIFSWFAEQVQTRNKDGTKPVVCVMDGARSLWTMLARYVGGVICILDIYHALEYLWLAA